ncbi:MAG: DUF4116 domain-containing protein, partial [Desulfovibrio sp.]|nr:DUF4116 domain-containing protein [Desulfovibrio sp.]
DQASRDGGHRELTPELCLQAVNADGGNLEYVPDAMKTQELCSAAVNQGGWNLDYVPDRYKTPELCLKAVSSCPSALQSVPAKMMTDQVCLNAVAMDSWSLRFIPKEKITPRMAQCAVEKCGAILQLLPARLATEDVCLAAVQDDGKALQWVPERCRTPELCMAAVKENGWALSWVPEETKTLEMCYEARIQDAAVKGVSPRFHSFLRHVKQERAYGRSQLDKIMSLLGYALAYAVLEAGEDPDLFFRDFIASGLAERIGHGDADSHDDNAATRIAFAVLRWRGVPEFELKNPKAGYWWAPEHSPEYRAGWALAWYQWKKCEPFADIVRDVPLFRIIGMELPKLKTDLPAFEKALDALRSCHK